MNQNPTQPLLDAQRLKEALLFRDWKLDVTRDQIRKTTWIGDGIENLMNDFLGKSATFAELSRAFARLFL